MSQQGRRAVGAALVALVALVLLPASPVSAHAVLQSSTPAANSVLENSPPEIVLDFDEEVEANLAQIQLFDAKSHRVKLGSAHQGDDASIVTASVPKLSNGLYAVIWRVTSADGHVVDGAFSFQIGAGASGSGQQLIDSVRAGGNDTALEWWYGIARFLSITGAILLVGSGWWALQGPLHAIERRGVRRLLHIGGAAMLLGSLAAFGFFSAQVVGGGPGEAFSPANWSDAAGANTGRMLLVRSLTAVVLVGLLLAVAARRTLWWRVVAVLAAVVAVVSFGASGHPNSLSPRALWIALDALHLAGIATWIGGLFLLAVVGRAARGQPEGERVAARFSFAASVAVPVIVATGVAQTLKLTGGLDDVTATDWGRLLLAKVVVIAILLAIAGVSRWLLQREGAGSLGRTLVAETALGLVVVGLAAGMVAQAPRPAAPSRPYAATITASGVLASVSISPGHVGSNEVHILITPPGGSLTPVSGATARVQLASAGIPFAPVTLQQEGPNHYSGSITFSRGGDWDFELVVQVTPSQSALLKTTVSIP